jgi:hypothetical protein
VTTVSTDVVQCGVFAHGSNDPSTGVVLNWTFQEPSRFSRFQVTWQPDGVVAIFAGWTEISPGIMQRDVTGPLSLVQFDGMPVNEDNPTGVSRRIGNTVFAFDVSIDDASKKLTGPWIVDDVGGHIENYGTPEQTFIQTHARMHRAPDYSYSAAFVHGMMFQCDNGDTYGGGYFTLNSTSVVLGTTAMDWSWTTGDAPTTDDKYEALTGPQLTSEGALTTYLEMSVTGGSGFGGGSFADTEFPHHFDSLALGVAELGIGPYAVDVESASASGISGGAVALLRVKLIDVDNGGAVIMILDSSAITAARAVRFVGSPLSAPYSFSPDRRLQVKWYLRTNSATPVTMTMAYNSSARGTKLTVPFVMPVSGASDGVHDHLSGRDTVNNHFGVGTCTTASGIVPVPTKKKMVVTVDGNPVLQGMHAEGLETGIDIALTFLQSCSIIGEAPGLGTGVCKFLTSHMDGSTPDNLDTLPAGARIGVTYYATELPQSPCFQLTWGPLS